MFAVWALHPASYGKDRRFIPAPRGKRGK